MVLYGSSRKKIPTYTSSLYGVKLLPFEATYVGGAGVGSPILKWRLFSYALGPKCTNFQQIITSSKSRKIKMLQSSDRLVFEAK